MLRCAIVGLGRWGQRLVDACQTDGKFLSPALGFTHAVVHTAGKHDAFCARQNLLVVSDLQAALTNDDVDAIVLATPHTQHAQQIQAAAVAGKHVFVEKPLALNHEDAVAAASACNYAGVVLALGHNRRFLPALIDLHDMIDSGRLGTITHMEGNFSGPFGLDYDQTMWRATSKESPAGGMTAMGIHVIDAMIHLAGPIQDVRAQSLGYALDVDIDDTTCTIMNFESGVSAMVSTLCATARQWRLQVFGTSGWAQMRDHHIFDICMNDEMHANTKIYEDLDIEFAELVAFAAACNGTATYPVPVREAVHGIAVQDAIIASAEAGGEIRHIATHTNWQLPPREQSAFVRPAKSAGRGKISK